MASSVRFDTSAKHPNSYYTQTPASSNKPKEPAGQKQLSATSVYQQKVSTQPSAPFSGAQYRQSPVKHTPSGDINSNRALETSGSANSASKQTSQYQIKPNESNALAAQLFTSSEEEDDDYQVTSDNYAMGEEEGGDPLTCGDSDFEPAEQSVRSVVPFHLQHRDGKAQSDYFGLDPKNILMSQYDFDHNQSSLLHSVGGDHYANAIEYKLAGEHEIISNYSRVNLGQTGGIAQRPPHDNQDAIYRLRATKQQKIETNQNNQQRTANLTRQTILDKNATKRESPSLSSENSYSSKKEIKEPKYTHNTEEQWPHNWGDKGKANSSNKKSNNSAIYDDEEEDDLDDDMNNDMESGSRTRLFQSKAHGTASQETTASTNVRRFARNTGTYQSSFSKPANQVSERADEKSPDSESDYYFRMKQRETRYQHNQSSNSSEEHDILIDPDFKSSAYHYSHYSEKDIEMKPISSKQKYAEAQARINQKQAATKLNQANNLNARDNIQIDEDKSVSVQSSAAGFGSQQMKQDKSKEGSASKSLTSFGWNQSSGEKKQAAATFETAQQARERERESQRWEQNMQQNLVEKQNQLNQYAMMYPQKQISKETWETQKRNVSGAGTTVQTPNMPTQKEKRKKKKESSAEAHFLLTGSLAPHLESRSFFRNTDEQVLSKKLSSSSQEQPNGREALMEWFEGLSLQDRVNSLTTTYPIFVQSIIDANQKHVRHNGPLCLFTIKKEKQPDVNLNEAASKSRRQQVDQDLTILERVCVQDDQYRSHNVYYGDSTSCRQFQTKILKFARITSNKQQMDTLTVSADLVRETQEFFSLLDNITDGKAFQSPITYVARHGSTGKPLIQSPRWIDSKRQNYLGVWIAAILEETLWAHFNFAKQVNIAPGVRKTELNSLFEPRSANLLNQEDLAKRWSELGEEGQKKLLDQLAQTAKEEQPAKFQAYADEMERRYTSSQSYQQTHQYTDDVYQFCNQAQRMGLYSYSEMPSRTYYDAMQRSGLDLESQIPYFRSSSYPQEQQGHLTQLQGQQNKLVTFLQSDTDLKEVFDVCSYLGPLDLIKFIQEMPLSEVNQRNYMRKHFLMQQLHLLIQENLRQSIQEQLMDELLAIDQNAKAAQVQDANDAKKKKGKQERSKKPRNNNQSQQQPQKQQQTYQKKKSISKSPEPKPQPQASSTSKEQNRLASTTTSDDQLIQHQEQQKQKQKQQQAQPRKKQLSQQKQKEIQQQVHKLLCDIVDTVCQLEEQRRIQSELKDQKANQVASDSESEQIEVFKSKAKDDLNQKEKSEDVQTHQTAQRRKRKNKAKKQDPEELVNQFVRKINGGDQDDNDLKRGKNQVANKSGQSRNNQDLKGTRQSHKQQQTQKQPHQQQHQKQTLQVQKAKHLQATAVKQDVEEPEPIEAPLTNSQKEKILPEPEKNKVLRKPPAKMLESQTQMVFVLETQPSLVDLNMKSKTVDLEPTDEVISLITPTIQEKVSVEEVAPVKVSLSEHFTAQAFIKDFKTVDDIFERQQYDNSQIQFIDYQQLPLVNEEQKQQQFIFSPSGGVQTTGVMSTTSVSFTPTLQLTPQKLSDQASQPRNNDTTLSPPLNKFSQSMVQPLSNNFFNENTYMHQQLYPPQLFDGGQAPSKQYQYQNQRQGEYQKSTTLYKKISAPFRQPQYQQHQSFGQPQYSQKMSPTSQSDQNYKLNGLGYQEQPSNFGRGSKPHFKKTEDYSQQQFYQTYGNGSPTQPNFHDNLSTSSSAQQTGTGSQVKTPAIRLDAPSFEPAFNRIQSDAPVQNQEYRNKHQGANWSQFGQNFAASQYDNVLPSNQHPLYLMLEDQFYRNFDKDIEKQAAKIQVHIQKYEEERQYVLTRLQQMANVAFTGRNPVIKVFGSLMTGLALVTSDMDIAVTGLRIGGRDDMIDDLHSLAAQVQKWQLIQDFKAIETASIPVIKAHIFMKDIAKELGKDLTNYDPEIFLPIDITIDDSPPDFSTNTFQQPYPIYNNVDHYGNGGMIMQPKVVSQDPMTQLQNLISGELGLNFNDGLIGYGMEFGGPPPPKTHLGLASCNLLKDYVRTYPYLKEVAVLLKRFLAENNLNQSYLGGISSYSAVLLIVAYMNNFKLHLSPHLTPSRLLMGFLDFYSNCFDPKLYGVNTTKGMSFYPLPQVNQNMFVVVDPVNPTNNTARNSYRTPEVLNYFRAAFFSLKSQVTKQFQKQMQLIEAERALKNESESVGKLKPDWGQKPQNQSPAGQPTKAEKAGDGNGQRQRQGPNKKINASSQQDPAVAKASEQQQPSSNFAGQTATTASSPFLKGSFGASAGVSNPTAQAFDSVNFVDCFLSSDILSEGSDKQANVVEALSGFGAGVF